MARQNYKAEKRRRELEKKKKKEAKLEKRLHRSDEGDDSLVDGQGLEESTEEGVVEENDSDQSSEENKE